MQPGQELRLRLEDLEDVSLEIDQPRGKSAKSAELFGEEFVSGREYRLEKGARAALFTWTGCTVKISGRTEQEYLAANPCMKDYVNCANILEKQRVACESGSEAPRVLVTGSLSSGKSALCKLLLNYAIRRDRTPVFVELDPRGVDSLPAHISAGVIDDLVGRSDHMMKAVRFFFGHLDWSKSPDLYEEVVQNLAEATNAKMAFSQSCMRPAHIREDAGPSGDGYRIARSGVIINGPPHPSAELVKNIIELFKVQSVLVIDDEALVASLRSTYGGGRQPAKPVGDRTVEVVPLPKSGGVVQVTPQRLSFCRNTVLREYFYGTERDFHPHNVSTPMAELELFRYSCESIDATMLPMGDEAPKPEFRVVPFDKEREDLSQLIGMLVSVIDPAEEDARKAAVLGCCLVISADADNLLVLSPAPAPLISKRILIGDPQQMKFILS